LKKRREGLIINIMGNDEKGVRLRPYGSAQFRYAVLNVVNGKIEIAGEELHVSVFNPRSRSVSLADSVQDPQMRGFEVSEKDVPLFKALENTHTSTSYDDGHPLFYYKVPVRGGDTLVNKDHIDRITTESLRIVNFVRRLMKKSPLERRFYAKTHSGEQIQVDRSLASVIVSGRNACGTSRKVRNLISR
jgi:hypothetical protein